MDVAMSQETFNQLYDRLSRYAHARAREYFQDDSLRHDAVEQAMDKFIDALMSTPEITTLEAWGKTVITNSLKNSNRGRKLEPITVMGEEYDGMHGYSII